MKKLYEKISDFKNYDIYKLEEFDLLPTLRGIYSWHSYSKENSLKSYHYLYKQKSYLNVAAGILEEKFKGELKTNVVDFEFDRIDDGLIKIASSLFSPSLYVGISKTNLKTRLNTHKRKLIELINDPLKLSSVKTRRKFKDSIDSDEESVYFAGRIAKVIAKSSGELNEDNLFVKVISIDPAFSVDDLKNLEMFLNRTFHPIYGRR